MRALLLLLATAAAPAAAQSSDHHGHGHHDGGQAAAAQGGHEGHAAPGPAASHNHHDTTPTLPPVDPQAGHSAHHGHGAGHGDTATPTSDFAPDRPAPAPPADWAADRLHPPGTMAEARARMLREHGGMTTGQITFNLAEATIGKGREGYRWDAEGWWGGDLHRLVVKSEGEGRFGETLEQGEVQALYALALDPYWNLQAGIRQDFGAGPSRTHATIGVEGLAPYWFEVEAALFLSDKGDFGARLEAWYDQRITQRIVAQPRAEVEFAAQDRPRERIGAGLTKAELGLRLRFEISREFAPYAGLSWERRLGDTARLHRAAGEPVESSRLVLGLRFWL